MATAGGTRDWSLRRIVALRVTTVVAVLAITVGLGASLSRWAVVTVPAHRRTVRTIGDHVREAVVAASHYVASTSPADRGQFQEGVSAARATLNALPNLSSETTRDVARLEETLDSLESAANSIWQGPDVASRLDSARRLDGATENVYAGLDRLDEDVASIEAIRITNDLAILGGVWLLGLLVYLGTGWAATRARQRQEGERAADLQAAITRVVGQLKDAREGRHTVLPEVQGPLAPVEKEAETLRSALRKLRTEGERKMRLSRFVQDLRGALELAETEQEVVRTAERAGSVAFEEHRVHLLLADNSESALLPQDTERRRCDPGKPSRCPVIRRHRIEQYGPSSGLGRCPHLEPTEEHVSCSFVPVNGSAIGALQVVGGSLDDDDVDMMTALAHDVGSRLGAVRALDQREAQASTDVLTGLANRRSMNERLEVLDRGETPYALIAADLDHFKGLNDTYGHAVGDRCLTVFAQVLRDSIREQDLACRPGGEEFTVILEGVDLEGARRVGQRILDNLREASRRAGPAFTVSLGVATWPAHGHDAEAVMRRADHALYAAKGNGRDQLVVAGDASELKTGERPSGAKRPPITGNNGHSTRPPSMPPAA